VSTPEAPRPGAWLRPAPAPAGTTTDTGTTTGLASATGSASASASASGPTPATRPAPATDDLAARLAELPVTQHVDVLAAEHDRLHRLLATVDQL